MVLGIPGLLYLHPRYGRLLKITDIVIEGGREGGVEGEKEREGKKRMNEWKKEGKERIKERK